VQSHVNFQTPPPPSPCPHGASNAHITYAFVHGVLHGRCSLAFSLTQVRSGVFDPYRRTKLMRQNGCRAPTYRTVGDRLRGTETLACVYFSGDWA
jgi:hypothetical protein